MKGNKIQLALFQDVLRKSELGKYNQTTKNKKSAWKSGLPELISMTMATKHS